MTTRARSSIYYDQMLFRWHGVVRPSSQNPLNEFEITEDTKNEN